MRLDRRALLRSCVALGSVGAAGCFGDDGDTTGTEPGGGIDGSPTGSPTQTDTPDPTPTDTTLCGVCTDRPDLLVDRTAPETAPGSTATVAATFRNPYPFAVSEIEIALDPPAEEWAVTPGAVTLKTVPPEGRRDVTWEVTIPGADAGEYTLTTVTTFRGPQEDYTVRTNHIDLQVNES
jgi:hypothetical protein